MQSESGFTLIETTLAMALVVTGVVSLAQLTVAAARVNERARALTTATVLAGDKVEELKALPWAAVSSSSPSGTLDENVGGFFDAADAASRSVSGQDDGVPAGAVFVRRWSIAPVGPEAVTIQVRVLGVLPTISGALADVVTVRAARGQ